ncbi:MAG: hypothetical protein F4X99_20250 [Gammaproteobacteria bacterium]|nr:hypothetical protein [Gammaproteobacteria bacterium]
MRVLGRLFAALGMLAVAACGRDASAPTAAPPQPPAVVVTFASDSVRIEEGETAEIAVRYRINTLSTPLSLTVSPLGLGAAPEDYELSGNTFDIPAGQGVTGTAAITLTALVDNQIAEGEEAVGLRLQPPGGVRAQLGPNLEVTIADRGASPCAGVQVVATRIESLETARHYRRTTLELTQGTEAEAVWFDWGGPFLFDQYCDDDDCRTAWEENRFPILEVNLVEWRMESSPSGTSDVLDIEWHDSNTLRFGFRSADGACEGEPTVACAAAGCELDR